MKKAPVIISLGGSLIVPKTGIDAASLKRFRAFIAKRVAKGGRFVLICGGGSTARAYQKAARAVGPLSREDVDWIGIHSTRLNAHLLRTVFRKMAHSTVVKNPLAPPAFPRGRGRGQGTAVGTGGIDGRPLSAPGRRDARRFGGEPPGISV